MAVSSRVTLITTLTDEVNLTSDRYLFVTVVIDIEYTFFVSHLSKIIPFYDDPYFLISVDI